MLKLVNGWHIVSKAKPLATSGYLSAMFGGRIDPLGVGARGGPGTWHSPPVRTIHATRNYSNRRWHTYLIPGAQKFQSTIILSFTQGLSSNALASAPGRYDIRCSCHCFHHSQGPKHFDTNCKSRRSCSDRSNSQLHWQLHRAIPRHPVRAAPVRFSRSTTPSLVYIPLITE